MVETFSYGRIDASKRGFDPSLWELSVNLISIELDKVPLHIDNKLKRIGMIMFLKLLLTPPNIKNKKK